ncbi:hypothetical protein [Gordonia sp. NB41Y]|uniref:hypothetical protein n=1 Tax=Gordonia sp. NB41Y TaxID=875808 RepID=UPI0006B17FB2|nr:hypothetical protein [Gordonia sp. NB41Y]EMP12031.2 hypothetical protein ISGA_5143 [Gordonia sp. NB41Y]WLP92506.1 hypothetical protein Q9K23_09890 [Gordonia sp. NB41Y]
MSRIKHVVDVDTPPSAAAYARERQRPVYGASRAEVARHNKRAMAEYGDRLAADSIRNAPQPAPPVGAHPPTPELTDAGDIGQAVIDLLRVDRIEAARTRCLSRIVEEERHQAEEASRAALDARIDEALTAAWSAAAKREKVPGLLDDIVRWDAHERITQDRLNIGKRLREAIDERAVLEAREAVRGALDEIDDAVLDEAHAALADAVQAHERLALAGVAVDADAGALVDAGDDGVLSALRLWRSAVARWSDVQAVRQWCAAALARGFVVSQGSVVVVPPPRKRSGEYLRHDDAQRHNGPQAEALTQGSGAWQGDAPSWLGQGSHEALRWWVGLDEHERPEPRGVADLDDVVGVVSA